MKIVFDWLIDNYRLVIDFIVVIISLVFFFCRRKKVVNEMDNILLKVLEKLPSWINDAESFSGADVKKSLVLEAAKKFVMDEFSMNLPQSYLDFISSRIEDILSTPKKK